MGSCNHTRPGRRAADAALGRGEFPATLLTLERDNPDSRHPLHSPIQARPRPPPVLPRDPFPLAASETGVAG
jgi:hypothetical protein